LDFAVILNDLGELYREMGDYKASESYYKQALEIRKKKLGVIHPEFAGSLNNLGVLYWEIGDFKSSETYLLQALEIHKKNQSIEDLSHSNSLNNLGNLYLDMRKFESANFYYEQSEEIMRKVLGFNHPDYAMSLNNRGVLNYEMGELNAAETFYKQAQNIVKKVFGVEHINYSLILNNLGELYLKRADFNLAELNYKQSLEIYKKVLGENHPDNLETLNSYAYALQKTNREPEAYTILTQNFSKIAKQTADNFEWLTDNQKEAYWKKESSFYEGLSVFANEVVQKVPEAVGLNFNASLLAKSKLLEVKILSNDQLSQEEDKSSLESLELREELGYRRRLLAKLESEGSLEKSRLDKLNFEVDSLDKRLTLSWPEYAQQKKNLQITWNQVQQNLEEGEAAIEFVRFKNKSDSLIYYNALVLKKGDSQPRLIQLCAEQDLQAITAEKGYSAYYGASLATHGKCLRRHQYDLLCAHRGLIQCAFPCDLCPQRYR
jgi:tetratricopeptide (TPR) repeat protein